MSLSEMQTRGPPASQGTVPVTPAALTVWFGGG